jgi:hypothetical protein
MQIFLCLKELESMVSKEENRLSTILEKGVLDNMTLRFIPSEQLEKLTSAFLFSSFTSSISMEFGCFDSVFFTDCP